MGACRQIMSVEPAASVARPDQIDAWLAQAAAGDRLIYASLPFLPAKSPGAARMRALSAGGLVYLTSPRSAPGATRFDYTAERSSKPFVGTRPVRPVLELRLIDAEAAVTDVLLPVLEKFAKAGRPCPSNAQLAERTGLAVEIIPDAFAAMRSAGLIRVHAAPPPTGRRVLILASGAMTGLVA